MQGSVTEDCAWEHEAVVRAEGKDEQHGIGSPSATSES
jgi:hypothetical protein